MSKREREREHTRVKEFHIVHTPPHHGTQDTCDGITTFQCQRLIAVLLCLDSNREGWVGEKLRIWKDARSGTQEASELFVRNIDTPTD